MGLGSAALLQRRLQRSRSSRIRTVFVWLDAVRFGRCSVRCLLGSADVRYGVCLGRCLRGWRLLGSVFGRLVRVRVPVPHPQPSLAASERVENCHPRRVERQNGCQCSANRSATVANRRKPPPKAKKDIKNSHQPTPTPTQPAQRAHRAMQIAARGTQNATPTIKTAKMVVRFVTNTPPPAYNTLHEPHRAPNNAPMARLLVRFVTKEHPNEQPNDHQHARP
jgi:hypothetical protein